MTLSSFRSTVLAGTASALLVAAIQAQPPAGPGGRGQGPSGRGAGPLRPMPPRDLAAAQPLPVGTSVVSGTVVVAGTGQPARRARVVLNATEGGGSRTTMTDESGRFTFTGLAGGRYSLSASKTGHVGVTFGQSRPGRPGTPIQLADGEKFTADLQLPRGSVITGTVLDEYGEPTPGTQVRALRFAMQAGRRGFQQSGSGSTDDRGIYRIFGLQPGEYIVSAVPRNAGPAVDTSQLQAQLEALRLRMATAGAGSEVTRELAVRASLLQGAIPEQEEQATGYAPVYFPGTTAHSSAGTVTLGIGEERAGVDFQLQRVPMARVEGTIVNSTPVAADNVQVTLSNLSESTPGLGTFTTRADREGRFRLANVPPGNYRLLVRTSSGGRGRGGADPGMPGGRGARAGAAPSPPVRLWGSLDVPVDGRNVSGIVVTLQQGLTISGRIAFDGTAAQVPTDLTRLRVNLAPADPSARELTPPAAGTVDASGRFTIPSVVPGVYRLTASGAGQGWVLESSVVDGQDSLDFPFEVKPGGVPGSGVITFTDRQSQLAGALTDQRGQPAPGYTLLLYPGDERFWAPQSRRIRSARPDTSGQYTFGNIPPGEYKLAALQDVEPGAWFDPAFLQQLEGASIAVRIGEGEKKVQNVQVSEAR